MVASGSPPTVASAGASGVAPVSAVAPTRSGVAGSDNGVGAASKCPFATGVTAVRAVEGLFCNGSSECTSPWEYGTSRWRFGNPRTRTQAFLIRIAHSHMASVASVMAPSAACGDSVASMNALQLFASNGPNCCASFVLWACATCRLDTSPRWLLLARSASSFAIAVCWRVTTRSNRARERCSTPSRLCNVEDEATPTRSTM